MEVSDSVDLRLPLREQRILSHLCCIIVATEVEALRNGVVEALEAADIRLGRRLQNLRAEERGSKVAVAALDFALYQR